LEAAIYFHPEAYSTTGPKLMGRNAAGESFLHGYLRHANTQRLFAQVEQREHAQVLAETARAKGFEHDVRIITRDNLAALQSVGTAYYPGPGVGPQAWQRRIFDDRAWSLCGVTHTTASATAMDAVTDLLTAPVQPWDALICTSKAVKDNVERLLQKQAEYLKERLGATRTILPQLPVIPLGLHCEEFAFSSRQRDTARASIGASPNTVVVLFMGRLSFHAKAHPAAMYRALAEARCQAPDDVILVECGWHANEYIRNAFAEGAREIAGVPTVTLDGRDANQRQTAWAAADIFCSLSDNIQETFGITPVEAMAAGLPVVVSDWDGYRDTVRDGTDGFRIPTVMPAAGMGTDLAARHALQIDTYDMYCGYTSSLVGVDIGAATEALIKLIREPETRARMGAAGQSRAKTQYDWSVIIPQYEALWERLAERRSVIGTRETDPGTGWPARPDPFDVFRSYPSRTLQPDTPLALVDETADIALTRFQRYQSLAMVKFAQAMLPNQGEVGEVLRRAESGINTASDLVADIPPRRRAVVFRGLTWLIKLDFLRITS
jgi:glycosyltransferase involved in cell wall biosynthesis